LKGLATVIAFSLLPAAASATPEETAAALSQLVINSRSAVARNFTEPNKVWWLPDRLYRYILGRNSVLPAAVVGAAVHPLHDDGVVVLKMIVREPRNDKNRPDAVEARLLDDVLRTGGPAAATTPQFAYHARPIKAAEWCDRCHGLPKGAPDPLFPKHKREGWRTGEVVGAATARVKR
jgi:hypothetical protein